MESVLEREREPRVASLLEKSTNSIRSIQTEYCLVMTDACVAIDPVLARAHCPGESVQHEPVQVREAHLFELHHRL